MDGRAAAYKLSRAGVFDDFLYILSVCLVHAPIVILNTLFISLCVYFMAGYALDAARFFVFWMALSGVTLAMSGWFRMIAYACPTFEVAHSAGGALVAVFQLTAGFLVTRTHMPIFMRWVYYLTPLSWALRTIALNEFYDDRYDVPVQLAASTIDSYGLSTTSI